MHRKAPLVVLAALVTLSLAAGVILALESQGPGAGSAHAQEFQRLVGGLGSGPALDLSRCPFSFDPRLCPGCPADLGPIPGGGCFCPHHACSIFSGTALESRPLIDAKD